MEKQFRAWVIDKEGDSVTSGIRMLHADQLPQGEVTIRVAYSGVNYKDGLASLPNGKIVKAYPFVPGIDLAGTVTESADSRYSAGDRVLVTGYGLGVSHFGGYSEYARVPGDWVVLLPDGLSMKEAMAIGTAGFTSAMSVHRLEAGGLRPDQGPVLVTGATGGVGSFAVALLARLGYRVTASTGKVSAHEWLRSIGAAEVVGREALEDGSGRALLKETWAGAVDPVGGQPLAGLLKAIKYGGGVAVSGLTGGTDIPTTVHPFILRGVSLYGIDSVYCPQELRTTIWRLLAGPWKPEDALAEAVREIGLEELPDALAAILKGEMRGRTIVRLSPDEY